MTFHHRVLPGASLALCLACASTPPCKDVSNQLAARVNTPLEATELPTVRLPSKTIDLEIRATRVGNLLYQLDCLADQVVCSKPAYEDLWAHLGWSEEDSNRMARWKDLRSLSRINLPQRNNEPLAGPYALPPPQGSTALNLQRRALSANQTEAWLRDTSLVLSEAEVAELRSITSSFEPRFNRWWTTEGRNALNNFFQEAEKEFLDHQLTQIVDQAAAFYESAIPTGNVSTIWLLAQPASQHKITHGTQLGPDLVVEVLPNEHAKDRLDVVLHELFHFLNDTMKPSAQLALMRGLHASGDPRAAAAYGLLDEALATALGNGLVQQRLTPAQFAKRMKQPEGLYNDPHIDAVGKKLIPWLSSHLGGPQTISSKSFLETYMEVIREHMPEGPVTQITLFSHSQLMDPEFQQASVHLRKKAGSRSVFSFAPVDEEALDHVQQHPGQPVVLFSKPTSLKDASWLDALLTTPHRDAVLDASKQSSSFAYVGVSSQNAPRFVVVAKDASQAIRLVDRLLENPVAHIGSLFVLDR